MCVSVVLVPDIGHAFNLKSRGYIGFHSLLFGLVAGPYQEGIWKIRVSYLMLILISLLLLCLSTKFTIQMSMKY